MIDALIQLTHRFHEHFRLQHELMDKYFKEPDD